jgi:hypothetical protein
MTKDYLAGYKRRREEGKIEAPLVIEEHCSNNIFEAYVKKRFVPILRLVQTVVLDNASFHKSKRTRG